MSFKFIPNWELVLKSSWAAQLAGIAGVLQVVLVVLQMFGGDKPSLLWQGVVGVIALLAVVARAIDQDLQRKIDEQVLAKAIAQELKDQENG
jgi:hypothetical protein